MLRKINLYSKWGIFHVKRTVLSCYTNISILNCNAMKSIWRRSIICTWNRQTTGSVIDELNIHNYRSKYAILPTVHYNVAISLLVQQFFLCDLCLWTDNRRRRDQIRQHHRSGIFLNQLQSQINYVTIRAGTWCNNINNIPANSQSVWNLVYVFNYK